MTSTEANGSRTHRPPPVWLFSLLLIPYGIGGAFSSATLGRILDLNHVGKAKITTAVSLSVLIAGLQFLWAPTVDIRLRRRSWYLIVAFLGGLLMMAAMFTPLPSQVDLFIVLVLLAQVAICLTGPCIGGLMATTVPDELRGRASGFSNFGNVGVGAIAAGVTLQLIEKGTLHLPLLGEVSSLRATGVVVAALVMMPALIVLAVDEPLPPRRTARQIFGAMLRDVWNTIRVPRGWSGILLCLSPVGTAAAMQLFTSFATAYQASPRMVTVVNGYVGGLLTGAACLLGGWLCDRMNRRVAYLLSGGLTAAVALGMALAPMTPSTYFWGALSYLFVTGFCYAAFTAVVLEIIGPAGATASTQYTLFTAAGNQAISYMIKLDGWGYDLYGHRFGEAVAPRGLLIADAVLNVVGIGLFSALLLLLRRSSKLAAP